MAIQSRFGGNRLIVDDIAVVMNLTVRPDIELLVVVSVVIPYCHCSSALPNHYNTTATNASWYKNCIMMYIYYILHTDTTYEREELFRELLLLLRMESLKEGSETGSISR